MLRLAPARFVFALAALLVATALSAETHGGSADPVVIEFGDQVVTRLEVDDRFQIVVRLLVRRQGISLIGQDPSVIAALRDQYLDKYASELVLLQEAERRQLAVSGTQVDRALAELFASEDDENGFLDDMPLNDSGHELLRRVVRDEQTIALLTDVRQNPVLFPNRIRDLPGEPGRCRDFTQFSQWHLLPQALTKKLALRREVLCRSA